MATRELHLNTEQLATLVIALENMGERFDVDAEFVQLNYWIRMQYALARRDDGADVPLPREPDAAPKLILHDYASACAVGVVHEGACVRECVR